MPASIGVNLRVTGNCRQGGRKYMEDCFSVAYQVIDCYSSYLNTCYSYKSRVNIILQLLLPTEAVKTLLKMLSILPAN